MSGKLRDCSVNTPHQRFQAMIGSSPENFITFQMW
jgi:hypothetical protein